MRMTDIIEKKRDGGVLSKEEIRYLIKGYVAEEIPDYQMAAWAMAVYFKGMNAEEISNLTLAMTESGQQMKLLPGKVFVDKHSTGGVGDKTTLILAPLVAACGVPIGKMSGRGLGHTGGTIDKLSSIPGFKVELTESEFLEQLKQVELAIISQTQDIVPADKKLYSLRDVTGTVDSIPLIASSIMSKKIAAGAQGIVLDVKYGSGAFMPDIEKAVILAETMVGIGKMLDRDTVALISEMNQPLGKAVGNSLEIIEVIDTLQGKGPEDLIEVCLELGCWLLKVGKRTRTQEEGRELLKSVWQSGKAWDKFLEFVSAQGGDTRVLIDKSLEVSPFQVEVNAGGEGFIQNIDARKIGISAMVLGAGRETKSSTIDYGAGISILKTRGQYVAKDEPILRLYTSKKEVLAKAQEIASRAVEISDSKPPLEEKVAKVIQ